MTPAPLTPPASGSSLAKLRASTACTIACIVGVVAYLLVPVLHGWHTHSHDDVPGHAHVHGHSHSHADHHHHDHDHGPNTPDEPAHESANCDICQVYFATMTGTDVPALASVVLPAALLSEAVESEVNAPVVRTGAPDRPLRGPPEARTRAC